MASRPSPEFRAEAVRVACFKTIKAELIRRRCWPTRRAAALAVCAGNRSIGSISSRPDSNTSTASPIRAASIQLMAGKVPWPSRLRLHDRELGAASKRDRSRVDAPEKLLKGEIAAPMRSNSAVEAMSNEELQVIAAEVARTAPSNSGTDWGRRESVRAKMRIAARKIRQRHGHPPDLTMQVVETVPRQAEALAAGFSR